MKYLILCFGRTDFTKFTIDSILENAKFTPEIIIINNGWNSNIVPPTISEYWKSFINDYRSHISKVYDIETINPKSALDAFSVPELNTSDEFHFISDNDCVLNPKLAKYFDVEMISAMHEFREINKLGVSFFRSVTWDYCKFFESGKFSLDNYFLPISDDYINEQLVKKQFDMDLGVTKSIPKEFSHKLMPAWSDTTLSIVRHPFRVSHKEIPSKFIRYAPTVKGTEMLHIGYLEPFFHNKKDELSNLEFIWYHAIRPFVLPRYFTDYTARKNTYLKNLSKAGYGGYIETIDSLLQLSPWKELFKKMDKDYVSSKSKLNKFFKHIFQK